MPAGENQQRLLKQELHKQHQREAAGDLPLGRRPTPEDVARAVAFLAESDSITGQILFVDGGQHLAGADHA